MSPAEEHTRRFIGRSEVLDALRRRLELARQGLGGFTWILGEVGIGKSLLIQELARESRSPPMEVLSGHAPALEKPPPLHLINQALQSIGSSDGTTDRGGPRPSPLAFVLAAGSDPAGLGFVPRMGGSRDGADRLDDRHLEQMVAPSFSGEGGTRWMFSQLSDRLLSRSEDHPVLLILEDLHSSDAPSLEFLAYLAPRIEGHPLWVIATALPRPSLPELVKRTLERVDRTARTEELTLRPFTAPELAEFVGTLGGDHPLRPEEITRWHSQTGGNPLFIEQIVRWRRERGADPASGERSISELTEFLAQQKAELSEEERRVVTVAAVLGKEFSFLRLQRASGEREERLAEITERLSSRGILREQPDEGLEFAHEDLRLQIYSDLTETRRRLLHRRAAEALEATGTADAATIYALARHFQLGRVEDRSALYNRLAGDIADRSFSPEVARDFYARALESQRNLDPENADAESKLVLELGRLTYELGRLQEAEAILRDFLDRRRDDPRISPGIRATLEIYLGRVLTARGDIPAATELAKKVLSSPGLEDQLLVRIGAHHQLGQACYFVGKYPEALAHHTEEQRLARELGNERVMAHAQMWRAGVLAMTGQGDQAVAEAREVAVILDRSGSIAESAQGHLFLGNMLADNKTTPLDRQEAIAELEKAVLLGEKAQDPRRVGWALCHTAGLLFEEGRFQEADGKAERAADILARIGDRVGQSISMKVRGQIAMERGAYDLAETDLLQAHRLLQGLNNTLNEIDVGLRLGQLYLARGALPSARRHVAELERQDLPTARPDLAVEFKGLKKKLTSKEAEAAAP
jgi:predicted ATPase